MRRKGRARSPLALGIFSHNHAIGVGEHVEVALQQAVHNFFGVQIFAV